MITATRSWSGIAPELLFLIYEAGSSSHHQQQPTRASRRAHNQLLLNCSLVCKSWADVAQSVLFRHVEIAGCSGYRSRLTRLVSTLSYSTQSRDRRFLAFSVRTLTIDIGSHLAAGGALCTHADASTTALAIHCCSNLRHLRLTVREGVRHSFSDSSLALLRKSRTITQLSIRADNSPMLPQLLHVWPQLTFLDSRDSSGFPCTASPAAAALPASCAIRELHASSAAPEVIARIAAPFSDSLRALTLVSHERTGTPPTRSILSGSVALTALTSATLDCEFDADTLDALPESVEHLGLVFWDTSLFRVLSTFISQRLDTIKRISLLEPPQSCSRLRGSEESKLLDLCAKSGIAVQYRSREELVTAGCAW